MAMKRHLTLTLREWQHHPITALGYCPPRREFLLGFEDGAIQWCDLENGKLSTSATEHHGMVTQFLYWPQPRLVFSSSIDGTLVVWTSGATILDRIQLGRPIFSISINVQRHMLVCGFKGQLIVFPLDERKVSGHVIDRAKGSSDHSHTDIVSQISCQDHHIYTTGYDKKLMVFDTYLNRDKQVLRVVHCNPRAHTAGITHLLIVRESESTRILTGSFDKTVGVWSQDAQLIYRITHFTGIITGLCYVPFVGTVWIASTNALPTLYDPRAGEIVSDFVDTFQDAEEGLALQRLLCPPEATHVVDDYKIPVIRRTFPLMEAGDAHFHSLYLVFKYLRQKIKRRASEISAGALHRKHQAQIKHCDCQRKQRINRQHQVFIWKYNCMGCVTILTGTHPIECLSYTAKIPILLFSGHSNGMVQKWERNHLSTFLYSNESVHTSDMRPDRCDPWIRKRVQQPSVRPGILWASTPSSRASTPRRRANTPSKRPNTACALATDYSSRHTQRKGAMFTRSLFVEDLDILVMSAEDGDIYIWEFDDSITGSDSNHTDNQAEKKCLLPRGSISETPPPEHEKVTVINKREAGLICKKLLCGHSRTVSGLALVGLESGYGTVYLLSGGWDCRLCLWDLGSCTLKDTFSNPEEDRWSEAKEVACEGSILDLAYSPERRLFAYSSSDGQVYIRHFGQVSSEMTLVGVLQGHEADVTAILWHSRRDAWISGSEDGTVRIWDGNSSQCHRILNTKGAVSCLCIDQVNGSIIAGVHDTIRVYDAESLLQVQTNLGHKDCVQSVIHIPELKQYASASWDCTIRLWNAYNCPPPKL